MHARRAVTALVPAIIVGLAMGAHARQPPPQQAPSFRSRVTVIPVDVRVVDRDGRTVKGLTPDDFVLTEDGTPQKIVQFAFQELSAQPAQVGDPLVFRKPLGESIAPQGRRIFLIVLGRGRQVGPVKGVQAAKNFISSSLLPQDQVAVLAYNRSTDFTTDHRLVVETLDRYWNKHEGIEQKLGLRFSGLAAQFSDPAQIPASIQKEIDTIFKAPGALASRSTSSTSVNDRERIATDTRRDTDRIQRAAEAQERIAAGAPTPFDEGIVNEAGMLDIGFDEYVEKSFSTSQDLGNLYAGIRYLRYLDGEKHLVFLTPDGLFLPRLENSNSIAALANDARVTIDILHTGGMAGGAPMVPLPARIGGRGAAAAAMNSAVPSSSVMSRQTFSIGSSKQVAVLTGGQMAAMSSGDKLFKRLDETTRSQYLLGYTPTNSNWNGAYRNIRVSVKRPGLTALYRHGYAGVQEVKPLDRRQYLTYNRIASAVNRGQPIADLQVTMDQPVLAAEGTLHATVHLGAEGVKFTREGDFYLAQIDCAFFVGDRKQMLAGELWRMLDFKLTEANYQKFLREGLSFTQPLTVRGEPRHVKVVLYDYAADLVGSAIVEMKKK
jgi:VWFA-related protein